MTDPLLQMYLMACIVVAIVILFFWKQLRRKLQPSDIAYPTEAIKYKRIKRVSRVFWGAFFAYSLMVLIYATLPEFYFLFLPLDTFHHPLINSIGMLIIKLSIGWIVVAQLHIDKELYKYFRNIESLPIMELIWYSEGMLLSGMLALFIGIFITITNVVGFVLTAGCLIFFLKNRVYKDLLNH